MTDMMRPSLTLTVNGEKFEIKDETKIVGYVACDLCKTETTFPHCANLYKLATINGYIFIYSSRPVCDSCRDKLFKTGEATND